MHRLLRIGFQSVGYWEPHPAKTDNLMYALRTAAPHPHTLYAFVMDGEVKYVGKTTRTLAARMEDYMRGPNEHPRSHKKSVPSPKAPSTNARVGRSILEALRQGSMVEIYALPDVELHHYGDFHLNLAAGLEDSIIAVLDPEWNGGKKTRPDGIEVPVEAEPAPVAVLQPATVSSALPSSGQVVMVRMGPTYWDKGFFNIGVEGNDAIGADGQTIELYCGNAPEPLLGSINRRANLNQTPRIFGGKRLRDWVQGNFARDAMMRVEVLTPTAIRLSQAPGA
jgi:hypothetical protein